MKKSVARRWDPIFLGEKFERIGNERVYQSHPRKAENRRSIGADAVLNQSATLALDPAEQPGKVKHHEEDEKSFGGDNADI
jgi:hypothetical protein